MCDNLLQQVITNIFDPEKNIFNIIEKVICDINEKNHINEVIDVYWKISDISSNKASIPIIAPISQRNDSVNTTINYIYKLSNDAKIGEIVSTYSKIPSLDLPNVFYYNINSTIIIYASGKIDGISTKIDGILTGATLDVSTRKYTGPVNTKQYKDFNGNKVVIERLPDDVNNPDKFINRLILYSKP